jgi:predicted nucleic acid-binding Zn ribbon protein
MKAGTCESNPRDTRARLEETRDASVMARGRFKSLGQLLPSTLEGIAERAAGDGSIGPAWSQAVGAPIARVTRPLGLVAGTLSVEVEGGPWLKELEAQKPGLIERLRGPFGGRVKKLVFVLSNGRRP